MGEAVIYHGTPLTPRAALNSIMPGRAGCVSFYRPDDLEALLAICPQLMFRPRRLLILDGGTSSRERMGRGRARAMVVGLLPMAGADYLSAWAVGYHARQSSRAVPAQRRLAQRLAVRAFARCAGLAYGRFDRSLGAYVRAIPARLRWMDWRSEAGAGRVQCLSPQDGRGCRADGERLAPPAYAPWNSGSERLPLHQRRQHQPRAKRTSIRLAGQPALHVQRPSREMEGARGLCRPAGGQAA